MDGHTENVPTYPPAQDPPSTAVDIQQSPPGDAPSAQDPSDHSTHTPVVNDVAKDDEGLKSPEQLASVELSPNVEVEEDSRASQKGQDSSVILGSSSLEEPTKGVENDEGPPQTPSKPITPPSRPSTLPPLPPQANHQSNGVHDSRPQSPALSVAHAPVPNLHKRSMTTSKGSHMSVVLISTAMETIAASKEAKRSAPLRDGIQRALELVRTNEAIDKPREILEPLRLACETGNEKLIIASLDCISKLISYSFFAEDSDAGGYTPPPSPGSSSFGSAAKIQKPSDHQQPLVDMVAHTIASCQNENTSDTISVQIVKALLGLVLSQSTIAHHHSLLQSVRTVYNVYLTSNSSHIQMLAQGSLTQMVDHIFNRCKTEEPISDTASRHSIDSSLGSIKPESELPPLPSSSESLNGKSTTQSSNATPTTPSIKLPEGDPEAGGHAQQANASDSASLRTWYAIPRMNRASQANCDSGMSGLLLIKHLKSLLIPARSSGTYPSGTSFSRMPTSSSGHYVSLP